MSKKCVNCGFELQDNDIFCTECGTKQPEQGKRCAQCGAILPQGAKFCMECGTPISAQNSTIVIADEFVSEKFETEYYWFKTIKGKTGDPEVIIGGIHDYVGPENIIIPSHVHYKKSYCVTHIADFAFSTNNIITSVTISDSITRIGSSAFWGCSNLKSVTIPNSVTSIGESAFYGCKSLETINIPKSVTSIGERAFYGCNDVTIKVPNERMAEFVKKHVPATVSIQQLEPTEMLSADNPGIDKVSASKKKSSPMPIPQPKQKAEDIASEPIFEEITATEPVLEEVTIQKTAKKSQPKKTNSTTVGAKQSKRTSAKSEKEESLKSTQINEESKVYSVIMTDKPIFRIFKSIKFDDAWMELAGITREKTQELTSKFIKEESLILAENLSLEEAKRWKTTLEDIGGKIEIQKKINN